MTFKSGTVIDINNFSEFKMNQIELFHWGQWRRGITVVERNYSSLLELYVCAATLWTTAQGGLPVIGKCFFVFFLTVLDLNVSLLLLMCFDTVIFQ